MTLITKRNDASSPDAPNISTIQHDYSSNLFVFSPQSLDITPTLTSILDKQASDPVISRRIFAMYPSYPSSDVVSSPISYAQTTYREFQHIVQATALTWYHLLSSISPRSHASEQNPVIAILSDTGMDLCIAIMAVLQLNATAFLLSPTNSEPALEHLLQLCNVSAIVYGSNFSSKAVKVGEKVSIKTFPLDTAEAVSFTRRNNDSHDTFADSDSGYTSERASSTFVTLSPTPPTIPIILHSSGSTSFPKPVYWSHRSFIANSQVHYTSGGWSAFTKLGNRLLCLGPVFHSMGISLGLGGTICSGSTIVFPLTKSWPPSPVDVVKSLVLADINSCVMVPSLLEQVVMVLRENSTTLQEITETQGSGLLPLLKLRILLVGGAHCPETLASYLVSNGVNLRSVYGSTEAGHMMVGNHQRCAGNKASWKLMRPIPHTSLVLKPTVDESGLGRQVFEVHMNWKDPRLAPYVLRGPGGDFKENEEKTWNTGDVVEQFPKDSGWYRLLFREDDILVHDSGEKTNPIPLEESARNTCPIISRMLVIGHQRPLNAAIISLHADKASKFTEEQRVAVCLEAVRKANENAPKHSRILDEMVLVLPIDGKKIPVTNKGNFIRPKVTEIFAEEIDLLYARIKDPEHGTTTYQTDKAVDGAKHAKLAVPGPNPQSIQTQIKKILDDLIDEDTQYTNDENLFNNTLDSVMAMALRNRLSNEFSVSLSQNFVYENYTVEMMVKSLTRLLDIDSAERGGRGLQLQSPSQEAGISIDRQKHPNKICKALFDQQVDLLKHCAQLVKASRNNKYSPQESRSRIHVRFSEKQVVAVVGATGSLGIWQVKSLLQNPEVGKVVCLSRGRDVGHVYDKLIEALSRVYLYDLVEKMREWKKGQLNPRRSIRTSTSVSVNPMDLDQRLLVFPFDLERPNFDHDGDLYFALASRLTMIIHSGWKMDFNQVVEGFQNCLTGTTQLLMLAGFIRPKAFYFVSSVGTVMEEGKKPVEEKLDTRWPDAAGKGEEMSMGASEHGYSQSKFIAERVVDAAANLLDIPCAIARIGQISGDLRSGYWKSSEMHPAIIAGSLRIGKYPKVPMVLDWIPVETVAVVTVELALKLKHNFRNHDTSQTRSTTVNHVANPATTDYSAMFKQIQDIVGRNLHEVSHDDWLRSIRNDQGNPCHALLGYIEENFLNSSMREKGRPVRAMDITRTLGDSETLKGCSPLDRTVWEIYIKRWKEENFIALGGQI